MGGNRVAATEIQAEPDPDRLWQWLALDPETLRRQCAFQAYQAQGPGGQKRNRVYSGMRAVHAPSGFQAQAHERREAERNRSAAVLRLREKFAEAVLPHLSAADPEMAMRARAWLLGMRQPPFRPDCSSEHADFPRHAVQAVTALAACGGAVPTAAEALDCSGSALVRFLKRWPPGWQWLGQWRRAKGLSLLH